MKSIVTDLPKAGSAGHVPILLLVVGIRIDEDKTNLAAGYML